MEHKSAICEHKTDNLPPQMTIFNTVIPIFVEFPFLKISRHDSGKLPCPVTAFIAYSDCMWCTPTLPEYTQNLYQALVCGDHYVPPTEVEGEILLLVRILSASTLLIFCTLSPEPMGGF